MIVLPKISYLVLESDDIIKYLCTFLGDSTISNLFATSKRFHKVKYYKDKIIFNFNQTSLDEFEGMSINVNSKATSLIVIGNKSDNMSFYSYYTGTVCLRLVKILSKFCNIRLLQ